MKTSIKKEEEIKKSVQVKHVSSSAQTTNAESKFTTYYIWKSLNYSYTFWTSVLFRITARTSPSLSLSLCARHCCVKMEDSSRPSFRSGGGERRLEIVSGRGYYVNQMYTMTRPDSPPIHRDATRPSQATAKPWGFGDAEMKRRKRIAAYKVYTVEGRVKASIRNGFRWIKNKCSEIIHGY